MAKYRINHDYFNELTTPEQAYILGFLWADGHVRKDGYAVTVKVNRRDLCIIEYIRDQLESNHIVSDTTYDRVILSLNSKQINNTLQTLGFSHRKTYSENIPSYGKYTLAFIRGLIDGDGSVWCSDGKWNIQLTGNEAICQMVYDYFGCGGVYKDHSVRKWQAGGAQQMKRMARQLLLCQGCLPKTRKVKRLQEIVME